MSNANDDFDSFDLDLRDYYAQMATFMEDLQERSGKSVPGTRDQVIEAWTVFCMWRQTSMLEALADAVHDVDVSVEKIGDQMERLGPMPR